MKDKESAAIEFLFEYKVTRKDLQRLDKDSASMLAILCFAVSEINFLSRTCISTWHDFDGDEQIGFIALSQRLVIMRTWTGKLYEITEVLSLRGKYNKSRSKPLNEALEQIDPLVKQLNQSEAFKFAR